MNHKKIEEIQSLEKEIQEKLKEKIVFIGHTPDSQGIEVGVNCDLNEIQGIEKEYKLSCGSTVNIYLQQIIHEGVQLLGLADYQFNFECPGGPGEATETGKIEPIIVNSSANRTRTRPIKGGLSIVSELNTERDRRAYGTLGMIVKDKSDGSLCGLTNAHVVAQDYFLAQFLKEKNLISNNYTAYSYVNKNVYQYTESGADSDLPTANDSIGIIKQVYPLGVLDSATVSNVGQGTVKLNTPHETNKPIWYPAPTNKDLSERDRTALEEMEGYTEGKPYHAGDIAATVHVDASLIALKQSVVSATESWMQVGLEDVITSPPRLCTDYDEFINIFYDKGDESIHSIDIDGQPDERPMMVASGRTIGPRGGGDGLRIEMSALLSTLIMKFGSITTEEGSVQVGVDGCILLSARNLNIDTRTSPGTENYDKCLNAFVAGDSGTVIFAKVLKEGSSNEYEWVAVAVLFAASQTEAGMAWAFGVPMPFITNFLGIETWDGTIDENSFLDDDNGNFTVETIVGDGFTVTPRTVFAVNGLNRYEIYDVDTDGYKTFQYGGFEYNSQYKPNYTSYPEFSSWPKAIEINIRDGELSTEDHVVSFMRARLQYNTNILNTERADIYAQMIAANNGHAVEFKPYTEQELLALSSIETAREYGISSSDALNRYNALGSSTGPTLKKISAIETTKTYRIFDELFLDVLKHRSDGNTNLDNFTSSNQLQPYFINSDSNASNKSIEAGKLLQIVPQGHFHIDYRFAEIEMLYQDQFHEKKTRLLGGIGSKYQGIAINNLNGSKAKFLGPQSVEQKYGLVKSGNIWTHYGRVEVRTEPGDLFEIYTPGNSAKGKLKCKVTSHVSYDIPTWNNTAEYNRNQIVKHNNEIYKNVSVSTGDTPSSESSVWNLTDLKSLGEINAHLLNDIQPYSVAMAPNVHLPYKSYPKNHSTDEPTSQEEMASMFSNKLHEDSSWLQYGGDSNLLRTTNAGSTGLKMEDLIRYISYGLIPKAYLVAPVFRSIDIINAGLHHLLPILPPAEMPNTNERPSDMPIMYNLGAVRYDEIESWSSSASYTRGDVVISSGKYIYQAKIDNPSGLPTAGEETDSWRNLSHNEYSAIVGVAIESDVNPFYQSFQGDRWFDAVKEPWTNASYDRKFNGSKTLIPLDALNYNSDANLRFKTYNPLGVLGKVADDYSTLFPQDPNNDSINLFRKISPDVNYSREGITDQISPISPIPSTRVAHDLKAYWNSKDFPKGYAFQNGFGWMLKNSGSNIMPNKWTKFGFKVEDLTDKTSFRTANIENCQLTMNNVSFTDDGVPRICPRYVTLNPLWTEGIAMLKQNWGIADSVSLAGQEFTSNTDDLMSIQGSIPSEIKNVFPVLDDIVSESSPSIRLTSFVS